MKKQVALAKVLNQRCAWFGQVIPEYVETGLCPGNVHQSAFDVRIKALSS